MKSNRAGVLGRDPEVRQSSGFVGNSVFNDSELFSTVIVAIRRNPVGRPGSRRGRRRLPQTAAADGKHTYGGRLGCREPGLAGTLSDTMKVMLLAFLWHNE